MGVSALGVVVLVLAILAFVALTLTVVMIPISRKAGRMEAELRQELGDGVRRIETVRGLGLRSAGRGQIRGTGLLVLTDDELRFRQMVPARETRIPLAAVTGAGKERWWLGKTVGRPLLRVTWLAEGGAEDAMAWQVRDLDAWLAELGPAR
jgi:hypothetical protein